MKKLALLVAVAASLGTAGCGRGDDGGAGREITDKKDAAKILESTPWLDRAPEAEADVIHAWVFPRGEGLYFVGNAYKGSYELFRYWIEEDEIRVRFLDDGSKHTMHYKVERVDDRVFDYKLTLDDSPRGPKVYFGFDHQHRELPAVVQKTIDHLPR